jgi:putative ABC transport system permease protein
MPFRGDLSVIWSQESWRQIAAASKWLRADRWRSVAAIVTLAAGHLVIAALFSLVNGITLKPFAIPDLDHLVSVTRTSNGAVVTNGGIAARDWPELKRRPFQTVRDLVAVDHFEAAFSRDAGPAAPALVEAVDGPYFKLTGAQINLGRALDDDEPCCEAVISDRLWARQFGRSPNVLGVPVRILGRPYQIVGVAAPDARGTVQPRLFATDVWIPLPPEPDQPSNRIRVFAALANDDTAFTAADAEVRAAGASFAGADQPSGIGLQKAAAALGPWQMRVATAVVAGVITVLSFLVLLIAGTNAVTLLLSRAMSRSTELAVRLALGATRRDLAGLVAAEAIVLVGLSAILGAALAWPAFRWIDSVSLPSAGALILTVDFSPDGRVIASALAVSALLAIVVASGSAAALSGVDPARLLAGGSGTMNRAPRLTMVSAQVTVSMAMLILAGVLVTGAVDQRRTAAYEPGEISVARIDAELANIDEASGRAVVEQLIASQTRNGSAIAIASAIPAPGAGAPSRVRGGRTGAEIRARKIAASPSLLGLLGVPLLRGEWFPPVAGTEPVAIIDELVARSLWPDSNPVEQTIWLDSDATPTRVVGVVSALVRSGTEDLRRFVFVPVAQAYSPRFYALADTGQGADVSAADLKASLARVDPRVPMFDARPLRNFQSLNSEMAGLAIWPVTIIGLLATLLAGGGLFALMTHAVAARHRELGVRKALGASRAALVGVVISAGWRALFPGMWRGAVVGLILWAFVPGSIAGVSTLTLTPFIIAPLIVTGVAAFALLPSAWQAARVEASQMMRETP